MTHDLRKKIRDAVDAGQPILLQVDAARQVLDLAERLSLLDDQALNEEDDEELDELSVQEIEADEVIRRSTTTYRKRN